ncbi:hypothetical protein M917_1583 [Psychrobacter aquaticus CMS 56]|uniref:Uncharacterized protein n=1 Tax=Psychrobacter aquaticus CMS 56 TaxID=1354303 RepID=U4TAT5_9GAMM|nr:hypothetical protein M917_1583 [Psychrobacter aquaticus CMS 56]
MRFIAPFAPKLALKSYGYGLVNNYKSAVMIVVLLLADTGQSFLRA